MALRLHDDLAPPADGNGDEIRRWKEMLENGAPADQHSAVEKLVRLRAEAALTECLVSSKAVVVRLATGGLWECWLSEQGPKARREMDKGIQLMSDGELGAALKVFERLIEEYPRWAEAHNKQATVFYLLGNARLSLKACRIVVELKPHHFGAWNGMALCAAQLEKWQTALDAARKALSLQPGAQGNLDLIQLAQSKLDEEK
jgi:tetratricopeptide (TPR) repeat protein